MSELVLLSDEELAALSEEQLAAYIEHLQHETDSWDLQPKQQRAEKLTEHCDIVGYGGAAGGGKSDWGLWHVYNKSLKYPKHRSLVLRRTFPELRRSLITRSLERFDASRCKYRPGDKEWHFDNGSVIEFGYLDNDDDVYQYKSAEYDCIFFDECTEFSEFQFDYLRSRARTSRRKARMGVRPHMIAATNPGGIGHSWFKRRLVKATNHGEKLADVDVLNPITQVVEGQLVTAFVPATLFDNQYIDDGYRLQLMSLPEIEMRQLLYGDWDVFGGQFFSEWRDSIHVVRIPWTIPPSWPRIRGVDYGFAAPMCCLWLAFDQDGRGYVYREMYEKGLTAPDQAKEILKRSKVPHPENPRYMMDENIDYTVADPAIWSKTGSGDPISVQYKRAGLHNLKRAMNARMDGWSRTREWLKPDPEQGGKPMLQVFSGCENLIRTLPDLVFDKTHVEDLDTHGEDHAADALRYALMSRPRRFRPRDVRPETLEQKLADNLDRLARGKKSAAIHPVMGKMYQ